MKMTGAEKAKKLKVAYIGGGSRGWAWGFMKDLAMENNLSETAYIVKEEQGYRLRWFAPGSEVDLCGHATLASSFVILNYVEPESDSAAFHTLSGKLTVKRKDNLYEMNFPMYEQKEIPVPEDPVCGSAHCQIADYWSKELGKTKIHAYQASKRGGHLYCEILGNGRIAISGEAALVAVSEVTAYGIYDQRLF